MGDMKSKIKTGANTSIPLPIHCSHDELVPSGGSSPTPKNPNRHPAAQIELLAKVIAATGWRAPIILSKASGFVIAGHGRLEAARLLGVATVPVNHRTSPATPRSSRS